MNLYYLYMSSAQAHVGTSLACMAAVAIQPFLVEGWRDSMGYPVQSRDQRLNGVLIYLFIYSHQASPRSMMALPSWLVLHLSSLGL